MHLANGDQYVWLPVTNATTDFSSSSEPPAVCGQSNPPYVTWSGLFFMWVCVPSRMTLTERYDFYSDMTGSRKWLQLTLK
jgi:hypothetical protein